MVDLDESGLFLCPNMPGSLRLTQDACSKLWERGQKAKPWESVVMCRSCPIGAKGAKASVLAVPSQGMCCRCGSVGMRLIDNRICISCYNRQRERMIGRDRRGKPPISAPYVYVVSVTVRGNVVQRMAAGVVEMALFAARVYGAPIGRATNAVRLGNL